jgi:PGF-CTERM protein
MQLTSLLRFGGVFLLSAFVLLSTAVPMTTASDHSNPPATETEIDGCTTITDPGYYRLTTDISNSSATECILIRSDDVVFDGRGHTIDGEGPDVGDHRIPIRVGYSNQYHVSNVTVKDVIVAEWFQGVGVSRASNTIVRNVTARSNGQYGIYIGDNATDNTITDSVVTDTVKNGIFLADDSDHNQIVNNTVRRNGNGIAVFDSDHNLVADNIAINNSNNGIFLANGADSNRVVDNHASHNRDGIGVFGSTSGNVIRDNSASNNTKKGIVLARGAHDNVVSDNRAVDNDRLGIQIIGSNRNTLTNNTARSNENQGFLLVNASDNVVRQNAASSNGQWAFEARDGSDNNSVVDLQVATVAQVTFTGGIAALGEANPPAPPAGKELLGHGVEVGDLGTTSELEITFQVTHAERSPPELWRYDGVWSQLPGSRFDAENQTIAVTLSEGADVVVPVFERPRTPTSKPTSEPTTTSPSPDPPVSQSPERTVAATESTGQPGFGMALTLLGLVSAGVLALRRR